MLDAKDLKHVIQQIIATYEVVGDEARPAAAAMMAEDLGASYPVPVIEKALALCRRELKGKLSMAAIIDRIDDGHPPPSEAWATAIKAFDERETVVWTDEMRRAWGVACPVMQAGDKVAARMAFIDAYTNELKRARADRRPAQYSISAGDDKLGRDVAVRAAIERGLLPSSAGEAMLLPAPAHAPAIYMKGESGSNIATGEPAPLLIDVDPDAAPEDMRQRLLDLKEELGRLGKEREAKEEARRAAAIEAERQETERRKKVLQEQSAQ